ncbi:MAG: hypothetical protein KDI11_00300, partial [Alphaproteobacteria bacterium]|nr:hypothetical protein [Alphaproteobacteria bacterium]
SHSAFAQKVMEQYRKPMPEFDLLSSSEFTEKTDPFVLNTFEDPALNFKIRIPKEWKNMTKGRPEDFSVTNKIMGEIVRFYGPPDLHSERSYLTVEAMSMDYSMTVEQWLMQFFLSSSYNVQGLTVHDDTHAEALYVFIKNKVSYAVRASVYTNGKHVMYAQYVVPIERWHDEKVMQKMVLDSFGSITPVKEYIEEMQRYQFLDLAEFMYPVSWELKALPIRTIDRMKVLLLNTHYIHDGSHTGKIRLDGQIGIDLVSIYASESLEDELNYYKEDIAEKGLVMGDVIEDRNEFLLGDRYDFVDTQVFKATDKSEKVIEHELWLTIMSAGDYYYFISLFTPSRDDDYFKWARNVETYKLVVNEITPSTAE